jgi:hypothetical protein
MKTLLALKNESKEYLVDALYNTYIKSLADFPTHQADPHDDTDTGKRVPYIGWFWRNVEFTKGQIPIGKTNTGFVGVMESNKWSYPERLMTEDEFKKFVYFIDKSIIELSKGGWGDKLHENMEAVFKELRDWMQTLQV